MFNKFTRENHIESLTQVKLLCIPFTYVVTESCEGGYLFLIVIQANDPSSHFSDLAVDPMLKFVPIYSPN